jgi:tRNA/rRNA methyltransferase
LSEILKNQISAVSLRKNLRVVLVRGENPVNIGQTARAMKNFSVSKLILVGCVNHQTQEAYAPGWKAKRILDSAKCFKSLDDVLKQSYFSLGFTTRRRIGRGALLPFIQVVPKILEVIQEKEAHLVFGNEKNGLSNEELSNCHVAVTIPADVVYPTLNLSHAVAVALFEIFRHVKSSAPNRKNKRFYASAGEYASLMEEFLHILKLLDYTNSPKRNLLKEVHAQIKSFFWKAGLEQRELHLFRAFLYRIKDRIESQS